MKPSERMKEILGNLHQQEWRSETEMIKWQIQAMLDFLDEEWELNKVALKKLKQDLKPM